MDSISRLLRTQGYFTAAEAHDAGYTYRDLSRESTRGRWLRLRHGTYTDREHWAALTPEQQHLTRCRAVLHAHGPDYALSHISGALAHGCDLWDADLDRVHITRLVPGTSRTTSDYTVHAGGTRAEEAMQVGDLRVLPPARCAIESAVLMGGERGLVVINSGLHAGLYRARELATHYRRLERWPGTRHVRLPLLLADPGCESPGESRGMWLFWSQGLPRPVCQYAVRDATGKILGIADWYWPEYRLLGEFDGRQKYGRLLSPGQDPGDAVFAEKKREDLLREVTGCAMVRLTWADLYHPDETAARIRQLMRRG